MEDKKSEVHNENIKSLFGSIKDYEWFGDKVPEDKIITENAEYEIIEDKNKNMENNTTVPNLNGNISGIIECYLDNELSSGWEGCIDGKKEAAQKSANAIEKLIIQEKIDLLNDLWKRHLTNNKLLGENFSTYITELQNQLNNIK